MVQIIFKGVNSSAVGLVFAAIYIIAKKAIISMAENNALKSITDYPFYTALASVTYAVAGFMNVPAPLAILGGGLVGIVEWLIFR